MIASFIASRLRPILMIAFGALALFAAVQTYRANQFSELAGARQDTIVELRSDLRECRGTVAGRDAVIRRQNDAVSELRRQSDQLRARYTEARQRAEARAVPLEQRAAEVLAGPPPLADELEDCRLARSILEEGLVNGN